ncbi:hypothetical protein L6R52_44340, partial [Myxococcota bacterium]|nr:hypothetical protein [Myxococcota bacterium]
SLAPTLEAMLVGWSVRTRADAAALHTGAVELAGRAVLLVGGKGSGKSTLAAYLGGAPDGASYLGDELSFVRYGSTAVDAFPKAATLKRGSFALFPESETHVDLIRGFVRYHLPPRRAPSAAHVVPIVMTIFPRWTEGAAEVVATELDPAEVSLLLVSQSFGGLERDPRMLPLVARLAQLPAFRLEYPDSASAAAAVLALAREDRSP